MEEIEQYILAQIKCCEDNIAVIRDAYIDEESLAEIQGMESGAKWVTRNAQRNTSTLSISCQSDRRS